MRLRLHDGGDIAVTIDPDQLSPRGRALAEAIDQRPLDTRGTVWLQSDRPLREVGGDPLWDSPDELDAPRRIPWDSWSSYPPDSDVDPHDYLEEQAASLPIGFAPADVPSADMAIADADLLTGHQVLDVLRSVGQPLGVSTWSAYVSRGQAPEPARHVGRTPLWSRRQVERWAATRPGRGTRTDLRT